MARRSPPVVNQTCESGCTWRMFGLFNLRVGHSNRKLLSNGRHLNTHATENGSSRHNSDVLSRVHEKDPHIAGSSGRRRDYVCRSISHVVNGQVVDQGNKATEMTIDQKFVNKNYLGEEAASCEPEQLLDALQILYSNKEIFLKLLQDPNSLLVKQIHNLQSSEMKEPYQAMEKRMRRLKKYENSNARQCGEPCGSSDGNDSNSSSEPQLSNKIVVLKPRTNNAENFLDTRFDSPGPHSARSFNHNAENTKPSKFPLGHIKRQLRRIMRVRRTEQQGRKIDGVADKFPCGCQGLGDGIKVKKLKRIEKRLDSSLDLKNRDKIIKGKDSEVYMGKETASFDESCSKITYNAPASPSEQNTVNTHVKHRKSQSGMIKCGIEEFKQFTNSPRRMEPVPDFESLQSLQRYFCKHGSDDEGMRYYDNYQMDHRTKWRLQIEGENDSHSSLQKINDAPKRTTVKTFSDKLQPFGADISTRDSIPRGNVHAFYDIPRDDGYKDSTTQSFDKNISIRRTESFQDSHPEIQIMPFSTEVASTSSSPSEMIEDTTNMSNRIENPSTESVVDRFTGENFIEPPVTTFQPDESPVQVVHEKIEENHCTDLIKSSLDDATNSFASSKDTLDCSREILQALSLKWDELVVKCESSHHLHDPSTFDVLKGSIGKLSCDAIVVDCAIENFMEVYQNCFGFPLHTATKSPNAQAYIAKKVLVKEITELANSHFSPLPTLITLEQLVGKDLARSGSWLNIQVDTQDIVVEVEEHVLENLVLEIVSEVDIRSMIHCNETYVNRTQWMT